MSLAAHERTRGTSGTMSHTGMRDGLFATSHARRSLSLPAGVPSPAPHPLHSPGAHSLPSLPAPWSPGAPTHAGTNTIPAGPEPHTSLDPTGSARDAVSQRHCQPQGGDRQPESHRHQELGPVSGETREWTDGPQTDLSEGPQSPGPPLIPGGSRNIPSPAAPPSSATGFISTGTCSAAAPN